VPSTTRTLVAVVARFARSDRTYSPTSWLCELLCAVTPNLHRLVKGWHRVRRSTREILKQVSLVFGRCSLRRRRDGRISARIDNCSSTPQAGTPKALCRRVKEASTLARSNAMERRTGTRALEAECLQSAEVANAVAEHLGVCLGELHELRLARVERSATLSAMNRPEHGTSLDSK
jgi:hypothetical protein